MGCWDETCALSNISIRCGDPVKLIIVTQVLEQDRCNGHAVSNIFRTLPISGTYNDYGCIEDIKVDWNTKAVLNFASEMMESGKWQISPRGKVMAQYDAVVENNKFDDIERLINHIERTYLETTENVIKSNQLQHKDNQSTFNNTPSLVNFVLIHEKVYKQATAGKVTARHKPLFKQYKDFIFATANFSLEQEIESLLSKGLSKDEVHEIVSKKMQEKRKLSQGFHSINQIVWGILNPYSPYKLQDKSFLTPLSKTSKNDFIKRTKNMFKLILFMQENRIPLAIQPGAGSQSANYETIANYYDFLSSFARQKEKELNEL